MSKSIEKVRWIKDGKVIAEWDFKQLQKDIEELDGFAQNADVGDDSDWDYLSAAERRLQDMGLLPKWRERKC